MRTLIFKPHSTDAQFFATVNQMFGGSSQIPTIAENLIFRCLNCAQRFDYRALGSSRDLGGAAGHLIDGSENRICRLSLELL